MSEEQRDEKNQAQRRQKGTPATFSGDIRGGGPGAGVDLGRGGNSTPTGDIAGAGQPASLVDVGDGTAGVQDAVPAGGAGDLANRDEHQPRQERLREKPAEIARSAVDGAPGIPAGGSGVDEALETSDRNPRGMMAADTNAEGPTGDEPDKRQVHDEDRGRNTL